MTQAAKEVVTRKGPALVEPIYLTACKGIIFKNMAD